MSEDKILNRIKALMAMGSSANENEANAFMAKAYRMMAEHGIEASKIDGAVAADAVQYVEEILKTGSKMPTETTFIWSIIEKFFNVRLIICGSRDQGRYISFVGRPEAVEIAMYVYNHLRVTYYSLWQIYQGKSKCKTTIKRSYYTGLEVGLRNKLLAEKNAIEQEYGLVIVEDANLNPAFSHFHPKVVNNVVRYTGNEAARGAGERDGAKIQLNKGVGSGGNVRHLLC